MGAAAVLVLAPQLLWAQNDVNAAGSTMVDSAHVRPSLFRPADIAGALAVSAIVLAVMPNDGSIAGRLQRPSVQSNATLKGAANVFDAAADPGVLIFSAATYFLGLGTHSRPIASLGMHTGEAIVLGGVIAETMKGSFGRARPSVSLIDSRDFRSGRGFSNDDFGSFPSAEVTIAFATATAASREVRRAWPRAARFVTPASYGAATLVGFARLFKNEHWASDVVAGAGIGTFSGILFDRYNRRYPDNVFDRIFLPQSVVPEHRSVTLVWRISAG